MDEFRKELENLINRYSRENGSNTPDFILAEYLDTCLANFDNVITLRERWYGRNRQDIEEVSTAGPIAAWPFPTGRK